MGSSISSVSGDGGGAGAGDAGGAGAGGAARAGAHAAPDGAREAAGEAEFAEEPWRRPKEYVSHDGDSWQLVARLHVKPMKDIREANPDARYDASGVTLEEGQTLLVPSDERDRFRHLLREAEVGNARAQYEVALVYANDRRLVRQVDRQDMLHERRLQRARVARETRAGLRAERDARMEAARRAALAEAERTGEPPVFPVPEPPVAPVVIQIEEADNEDEDVDDSLNAEAYETVEFRWLSEAASRGYAPAQYRLATIYATRPLVVNKALRRDERRDVTAVLAAVRQERDRNRTRRMMSRPGGSTASSRQSLTSGGGGGGDYDDYDDYGGGGGGGSGGIFSSTPGGPGGGSDGEGDLFGGGGGGGDDDDDDEYGAASMPSGQELAHRVFMYQCEEYMQTAAGLYERAALQGHLEAAARLADCLLRGHGVKRNFRKAIYWLYRSGKTMTEAEAEVAGFYTREAELSEPRAALQLARMYVDGVGMPMDFDKARFWFGRGGKTSAYARRVIEGKRDSLAALYHELFRAHDSDDDGQVDKRDFMGFYRDCLMAKGYPRKKADEETVSPYLGVMKSDSVFRDYDLNNDYKISFDEIWEMRDKISTLVPNTEKHYQAALAFFRRWAVAVPQSGVSHILAQLDAKVRYTPDEDAGAGLAQEQHQHQHQHQERQRPQKPPRSGSVGGGESPRRQLSPRRPVRAASAAPVSARRRVPSRGQLQRQDSTWVSSGKKTSINVYGNPMDNMRARGASTSRF